MHFSVHVWNMIEFFSFYRIAYDFTSKLRRWLTEYSNEYTFDFTKPYVLDIENVPMVKTLMEEAM